jgi:hypothetical protein
VPCVPVKQPSKQQLSQTSQRKPGACCTSYCTIRLASALIHSYCIMAILFSPVLLLNRHRLAPRAVVECLVDVQITVIAEQLLAIWTPHHHSQLLQQTTDHDHRTALLASSTLCLSNTLQQPKAGCSIWCLCHAGVPLKGLHVPHLGQVVSCICQVREATIA